MRAEGPVDEQVARSADRAQLARLGDVLLGPVADDARAGFLGGEPQQPGEVVLGGDFRAGALVDRADAERDGVREGGALCLGALPGRDGGVRGGAHGVVGVGGERPVLPGDAGDQVEQGGRDDRRVDVDAGEVEGPVPGGLVEFGPRRGPAAGPAGGVPAVPEQHAVVGAGGGEVPYEGEGGLQGGGARQIETRQGETGGGGVHMRVRERGGDQRPVEVDDLVDAVREGVGGALGTDPGDLSPLHDHRGGEGIGRTVDLSTTEENGLGRRTGLTHGAQFHRPGLDAPQRGGTTGQIRGGRASYGVDNTTVVRVDTPASDRTRARSSSSSWGVATRTLRM